MFNVGDIVNHLKYPEILGTGTIIQVYGEGKYIVLWRDKEGGSTSGIHTVDELTMGTDVA